MSRTDDILDKTKRKEPEAKKWKVVVGIVVGLVFGGFLFLGFWTLVMTPIVDDYVTNTKQTVAVYDFYDLKVGENETAVYFIGSSWVGCGIDSDGINQILEEKGHDITAYNLGIDGDTHPLQTSLQVQNIIDSNPSLVVFGVSYSSLNHNEGLNDEKVFLVHDKLNIRDDAWSLYSDEDKLTLMKPRTIFDEKRFTVSALVHFLKGSPTIDVSGSTDMYTLPKGGNWRYTEENNVNYDYDAFVQNANKNNIGTTVTRDMTEAKVAMLYNAKTLSDAGIPVIFINMPIHPERSQDISDESRQIFFDFMNTTGVKWYDYEYACQDDIYWYKDAVHMAPVTGAGLFAPVMAELIIQEMS